MTIDALNSFPPLLGNYDLLSPRAHNHVIVSWNKIPSSVIQILTSRNYAFKKWSEPSAPHIFRFSISLLSFPSSWQRTARCAELVWQDLAVSSNHSTVTEPWGRGANARSSRREDIAIEGLPAASLDMTTKFFFHFNFKLAKHSFE